MSNKSCIDVQKSFRQSFLKLSLQKTVADSDLPYFRCYSRQRGRGFGAFAQTIGRTAIPFLRRYVVPAAKRVGADLIELAAPEIGNVLSGRKKFKSSSHRCWKENFT